MVSPCIYWYSVGFVHEPEGGGYPARRPIWNFLGTAAEGRNIPADNPKRKRGAESYMLSTPRLCKGLGFVEEVLVNPLEGVGPFHLHADTVLHHKTG